MADENIGYWKFDENVGTEAQDSSPYNHRGILVNNPVWVSGRSNSALLFTRTDNQYVDVTGTQRFFDAMSGFSVSVWFNVTGYPLNTVVNTLVSKIGPGGYDTGNGWILAFLGNNAYPNTNCIAAYIEANHGADWNGAHTNTNSIPSTGWNHVAFTVSGISDTVGEFATLTLYLNNFTGNSVYDRTVTSFGTGSISNNSNLRIANSYSGGDGALEMFDGIIDDVRIYNYPLTPLEVSGLYFGSSEPSLPKFWGVRTNGLSYGSIIIQWEDSAILV